MPRPGPVLIDNNALSEALRIGAWNAISKGLQLESVEEIQAEALTGWIRRDVIDPAELRERVAIHAVTGEQRALLAVATAAPLDPGERDLWAHALTRADGWVLCGPDRSSVKAAVDLGLHDRLRSLEELLEAIGFRPRTPLKPAYGRSWLSVAIGEYVAGGRL